MEAKTEFEIMNASGKKSGTVQVKPEIFATEVSSSFASSGCALATS